MYRVMNQPMAQRQPVRADGDWTSEIRRLESEGETVVPYTAGQTMPAGAGGRYGGMAAPAAQGQAGGELQMQNGLPVEVVEDPVSREEVYMGSLKALLKRNVGNYIVATFLVGTQSMVPWEGILYDVGNDYITIFQEGRSRYILGDIYSLKFVEFYDNRTCR